MIASGATRKAGPNTGDGVTATFPFGFKVFANTDLLVVLTDLTPTDNTQTLTSQYTVSINANQDSNPGGSITMVTPPLAGYLLTVGSQMPNTQPMVLTNTGGFYPTVLNNMADWVTILIQQLSEKLGRALTLPFSVSSGVSATLPPPVANNFLGWNTAANALVNYAGFAATAVSAAMAPVIGAATTALARLAMGVLTDTDAWCGNAGGTANAVVIAPVNPPTVYAAGQTFTFKATAPNTAATTIAVGGLAALAAQVNGTAMSGGEIVSGQWYRCVVDGSLVAMQVTKMGRPILADSATNLLNTANTKLPTLTATVGSNALTIGASSIYLDFRSATLGSGTISTINAAPSNLVVPSGATLGTVSAQQSRIVVAEMNNAGTAELAVVNISGGVPMDETGVISTTTISAGATAANVWYSTTGRTSLPYRIVGYVESTQATAGTWATAPSTIQCAGGNALSAMSSLGYGQTWQAVTRTAGTTYYNTTGKPITYCGYILSTASASISIAINGITAAYSSYNGTAGTPNITVIIPVGASYVLTIVSPTGYVATELR